MTQSDLIRGRAVDWTLTNKSGGAVAAGDVVVIGDGTNDNCFTTTTSASFNARMVGVAQEAIANNAVGRIRIKGYCPIVNTNASVTRDHFLFTHTTAKEATGSATRVAGAFGQVLETGADPEAIIWGMPDATAATAGPYDIERYTGGDITISSTTAGADFPTLADVVVAAAAGDLLLIGVSLRPETVNTSSLRLDVKFITGATENYLSSEGTTPSAQGVSGWFFGASTAGGKSGAQAYVVQAADISGGNVTCSLRAWLSGAQNWVIAADADAPLKFWVKNLKQ